MNSLPYQSGILPAASSKRSSRHRLKIRWLPGFLRLQFCCWLALSGGRLLEAAEDVFVIRADATYSGTDTYKYEETSNDGSLVRTVDREDNFNYHYVGVQTIRITEPDWTETYANQYTVSGGGNSTTVIYKGDEPPDTGESQWSYSFDPTRASESDGDMADFDEKFTECSMFLNPSWPVSIKGQGTGGAALSARFLQLSSAQLGQIPLPTDTTSYTVTRTYGTNTITPYNGRFESGQLAARFQCTVTIQRNPVPLEAVIVPDPPPRTPLPSYDAWLPVAGADEDTPGTNFMVRVILRPKGSQAQEAATYARARFTFRLNDVSQEPGICLNYPPKDRAKTTPDFKLESASKLKVSEDGLSAETLDSDLSEATVMISAYDYGAFGKLSVAAQIPGQGEVQAFVLGHPDQTSLPLPKDENNNHIADAWEKENGTWGEVQDPAWDQADMPDGQDADGDGISLYEKYRGFIFAKAHERLEARRKHLFVYDPDGLVRLNAQSSQSFQGSSLLRLRFVTSESWTGPGPAGSDMRVVNFNTSGFGHATDQHAQHVRMVTTKAPATPADYQALYKAKYGTNSTEGVDRAFGMTYPDFSVAKAAWSPEQWLFIECYLWNIDRYARDVVTYHTFGLAQFAGYGAATPAARAAMDLQAQQWAADHITSHPADWQELNWMVLMMTTSHEMGHAVAIQDLQPPRTLGPLTCFMRYLGWDFPRNPADRFELEARWHEALYCPVKFCQDAFGTVPGKGCFKQIHVTDRATGATTLDRLPGPVALRAKGIGRDTRRPLHLEPNPWISLLDGPTPALRLTAGLEWESPLVGDPLRVSVRLNSPLAGELWELAFLTGETNAQPAAPAIASNWVSGLQLELARLETNGTRTVLLAPGDWAAHLRPTVVDPTLFERRLASRQREFLVSPSAARLEAGDYSLRVSWHAAGLVEPQFLPEGGVLAAKEIQFRVAGTTTDAQRALHLRRLAFHAWDLGQNASAREYGTQSLQLEPGNLSREGLETRLVLASAAVQEGDWFGSAAELLALRNALPGGPSGEVTHQVDQLLSALVPELRLKQAGSGGVPARLEVLGHVGQTYRLEASDDLRNWVTLQTLTTLVNRFEVAPPGGTGPHKFFRLVWLKQ